MRWKCLFSILHSQNKGEMNYGLIKKKKGHGKNEYVAAVKHTA